MQFITNGPDIPEILLQMHEEGRVVFFCGAGISYPAGLPGFCGLVKKIYRLCGTALSESELEQEVFKRKQYDATLDLLERRLPGQRLAVRRGLAQALKPNLSLKGAIDTQAALLQLSRDREGSLRLVTTNFDRLFHAAAKRSKQPFQSYSAPVLPVPKKSRWDSLVFLHGLLPEKDDDSDLNRLVVTSGDFGLAYLTERWAARFVSELFRNYVVCFVGYSIDDPVLRYMMDALAADRMQGELTPEAWAFGECEPGQEKQKAIEWKAKGVTPILYHVPAQTKDHSALHQTLHAWAETYREGVMGKEAIIAKHALARPVESTQQDHFVGRMLWALADKSGLPAKRFAEFNPVPSLDWLLEPFTQKKFGHDDLNRFGVPPEGDMDAGLKFSLVERPAPYNRSPFMRLFSGEVVSQWDAVMYHIGRWLIRHLDDPRLIVWIAENGGQPHESFSLLIEHELERLASLEYEGKTYELDEIRSHAPKAIPCPNMRKLWHLMLSGRVISQRRVNNLYRWKERVKREGLTILLRLEFRELLTPRIILRSPFHWGDNSDNVDEPVSIRQQADWELVLTAENVRYELCAQGEEHWKSNLPFLLEELQQLLRDALELLQFLGEAEAHHDRSSWVLPSIAPHSQNRGYCDWVCLIELLRDAWIGIYFSNKARSTEIAQSWFKLPYSTFKRLALFAVSQDDCVPPAEWVSWLMTNDAWWLWSSDTGREVCRLLVLQGRHLEGSVKENLEKIILTGPQRGRYKDDIEDEQWQEFVNYKVWLYLAKINSTGIELGEEASARLVEISAQNPQWKLTDNERDEFSHWSSGTGDRDFDDYREIDKAPRKWRGLVQWLKKPVSQYQPFYEDTWREICRTRFFHSLFALYKLSQENTWPVARWRGALNAWREEATISRSWQYAAPLVSNMPDDQFIEIVHSLSLWLEDISRFDVRHDDILLELCSKVLALPLDTDSRLDSGGGEMNDIVGTAINHSIGHVTQVIINLLFQRDPKDNDRLPAPLKPIFTSLCNVHVERFCYGRVLLASRLIELFRVDRQWTEQHLLPLFDWSNNPNEAKAMWEGFMWSPRLHQPLLMAFKTQLLDTANHFVNLSEHRQQFATFLTFVALGPTEGFTAEEFRTAITALSHEGLLVVAQTLFQALESAGDQREDYWKYRVQPFWDYVWPKSQEFATPQIAKSLAQLAIAAGGEFPTALANIQDWLQPIEPYYVINQLHKSGLCHQFPEETLVLLDKVLNDQQWVPRELGKCLDEIAENMSLLTQNIKYQRIRNIIKKHET
ncbi:SIR2 family protein [Hafnia paralvei]|uniref:anti-phage defense-associated sirtuin Dsr1 n=1 Tax=Hafnia paralvei TaxID=546367 RepID=UPI001C03BA9B|nr:anti-phage defense-associated sirtuin Dsr1 [Hafnia paralvei]MBU2673134.1 SIR2 family protein [Hafnia paralvei]